LVKIEGVKFMSEAKIVVAIKKFIELYAWDKSLIRPNTITRQIASGPSHANTAIEDFLNGSRSRKT
jgi:hypothetical protein